jgi:hypothetical protein
MKDPARLARPTPSRTEDHYRKSPASLDLFGIAQTILETIIEAVHKFAKPLKFRSSLSLRAQRKPDRNGSGRDFFEESGVKEERTPQNEMHRVEPRACVLCSKQFDVQFGMSSQNAVTTRLSERNVSPCHFFCVIRSTRNGTVQRYT